MLWEARGSSKSRVVWNTIWCRIFSWAVWQWRKHGKCIILYNEHMDNYCSVSYMGLALQCLFFVYQRCYLPSNYHSPWQWKTILSWYILGWPMFTCYGSFRDSFPATSTRLGSQLAAIWQYNGSYASIVLPNLVEKKHTYLASTLQQKS